MVARTVHRCNKTASPAVIHASGRFAAAGANTRTPAAALSSHTEWRRYPAHRVAPMAAIIAANLDCLSAVDPLLRNALRGDAASAIKLAIGLLGKRAPFDHGTDLVMMALTRCALKGSSAAATVMGHVIRSFALDEDHGSSLASSWFAFKTTNAGKRSRVEPPLVNTAVDTRFVDLGTGSGEGRQ